MVKSGRDLLKEKGIQQGMSYKVIKKPTASYVTEGRIYKVLSIDASGTVHWQNPLTKSGTSDKAWAVFNGDYQIINV